jgi:hypothetical protein
MHAGIAVALGLWSFSALMIVLNAAAFLTGSRVTAGATLSTRHRSRRLAPALES